jgi:hypothetical protein
MDIELRAYCVPKMQPSRFVNPQQLQAVKSELDRLESWGVIQKTHDAPIASPLVIVKKPDNSIRLAVDYRQLNDCILPTANQLTYQETLFQQLCHQTYFAKLDNLWGFHQLKLTERAQQYCSINTPFGLYKMIM